MSKKYVMRVKELEEMKNALNMFKSKIKFTYEPIPEIFNEIGRNTSKGVGQVFNLAKEKMRKLYSKHCMGRGSRRKRK